MPTGSPGRDGSPGRLGRPGISPLKRGDISRRISFKIKLTIGTKAAIPPPPIPGMGKGNCALTNAITANKTAMAFISIFVG